MVQFVAIATANGSVTKMGPEAGHSDSRAHLANLDALRGVAALTVVNLHYFSLLPGAGHTVFDRTPVAALWAGNSAVLLFFLLSGFVLARMIEGAWQGYGPYVVRRVCRLWIPFAVAIAFALLRLAFLANKPQGPAGTAWLQQLLNTQVSAGDILRHYSMVLQFDSLKIDIPVWSLAHEMRLSLAFPLIYFAFRRYNGWLVSGASLVLALLAGRYVQYAGVHSRTDFVLSLIYQAYFVAGCLIALHYSRIRAVYRTIPRYRRWILLAACITFYSGCLGNYLTLFTGLISSAGIVIAVLSSAQLARMLAWGPFGFLGRISYSLYLYHLIVLQALLNVFYPGVAPAWIVLAAFPLALAAAYVATLLFDAPAIALSRRMARAMRPSLAP